MSTPRLRSTDMTATVEASRCKTCGGAGVYYVQAPHKLVGISMAGPLVCEPCIVALRQRVAALEAEREETKAADEEVCTDDNGQEVVCVKCKSKILGGEGGYITRPEGSYHMHACYGHVVEVERDAALEKARLTMENFNRYRKSILDICGPVSDNIENGPQEYVRIVVEQRNAAESRAAARAARVEVLEGALRGIFPLAAYHAFRGDKRVEVARAALVSAPCATCDGKRYVCDAERPIPGMIQACSDATCPHNRRPCQDCASAQRTVREVLEQALLQARDHGLRIAWGQPDSLTMPGSDGDRIEPLADVVLRRLAALAPAGEVAMLSVIETGRLLAATLRERLDHEPGSCFEPKLDAHCAAHERLLGFDEAIEAPGSEK